MTDPSLFLGVSNARSGSTWLETSLGALPDVSVDFEMKWRQSVERRPVHLVIEDGTFSVRRELREIAGASPVGGSKLVLDGHLMFQEDEVETLRRVIEPDVRVIHLTRNYFEVMRSLETRIIRNTLTDASDARLAGTRLREALVAQASRGGDEQMKLMWIVRDEAGRAGAAAYLEARKSDPAKFKLVTLDGLIRKFLILLNNDLIANDILLAADRGMTVDHATVGTKLPEIAGFVGSAAADDAVEIGRNPLTRERDWPDQPMMQPENVVGRIAEAFDALRDRAVADKAPRRSILRVDPESRQVDVESAELEDALADAAAMPLIGEG